MFSELRCKLKEFVILKYYIGYTCHILLEMTEAPDVSQPCPLGCLNCFKWNGCVACAENFTWHLEQRFMRTIGVCLRECPTGYYKEVLNDRQQDLYKCSGTLCIVYI